MKVLLLVCFMVSISSGAEVDFSRQRGSNAAQAPGGRPIAVPVVQSRNNGQQQPDGQQKRQLELPNGGRPSNPNAASFRQQAAVPLQQPFQAPRARPAPSASAPSQEQPKRSSPSAAAISSFAEQHQPPAQSFVPFNEAGGERPQRQSTAPVRPLIPFPSGAAERKNPPASRGNPEFERGFPEGFTSGLPAFDFQGRMPEPDEKSEGFMDGALDGFPNLKSFGGFDAMPDTVREDVVAPPKRLQGGGRPGGSRPSSQERSERLTRDADYRNAGNTRKAGTGKPSILDDEMMLEPDFPTSSQTNRRHKKNKEPTDIADIIAEVEEEKLEDSDGSEQRFQPSFYPNLGPYGRPIQTHPPHPPAPIAPPPSQSYRQQQFAPASSNGHLPPSPPVAPPPKSNSGRVLSSQRSPFHNPPSYVEPVEDNSILGSGNFQVITGGIFSDPSNRYKPFNNYFSPPVSNHLPSFQPTQRPPSFNQGFQPYYNQQQTPFQSPLISSGNPPYQSNPGSFFGGGVDEFFSNFRDFADVNQDYRRTTNN